MNIKVVVHCIATMGQICTQKEFADYRYRANRGITITRKRHRVVYSFNHLTPSRCIKASFYILEKRFYFYTTKCLWIFTWNWLPPHGNFLYFFTHFKSSSSTTNWELLQRVTACSGWRWQCKVRLEGVKNSLVINVVIFLIGYILLWCEHCESCW